jgi:hypothetical protein
VLVDEDADDTTTGNAMDVVGGATTAKPLPPLVSLHLHSIALYALSCLVSST